MKPAKFQSKKKLVVFLYINNEQSEKENHSKHSHIKKKKNKTPRNKFKQKTWNCEL